MFALDVVTKWSFFVNSAAIEVETRCRKAAAGRHVKNWATSLRGLTARFASSK